MREYDAFVLVEVATTKWSLHFVVVDVAEVWDWCCGLEGGSNLKNFWLRKVPLISCLISRSASGGSYNGSSQIKGLVMDTLILCNSSYVRPECCLTFLSIDGKFVGEPGVWKISLNVTVFAVLRVPHSSSVSTSRGIILLMFGMNDGRNANV